MLWSLVWGSFTSKLGVPIISIMEGLLYALSILWRASMGARSKMSSRFPHISVLVSRGTKIISSLVKPFLNWRGTSMVFLCPRRGSFILPVGGVFILRRPPRILLTSHSGMWWVEHSLFPRIPQFIIFTPINVRVVVIVVMHIFIGQTLSVLLSLPTEGI